MEHFEEVMAAICLSVMTLLTFINVIARYVFSASFSFTDEITTNLFVLLTLLGAAIAAKRGAHLGLTVVTDMLPYRIRKCTKIIGYLFAVLFCALLIYYGVVMVIHEFEMKQLTAGMQWPEWIFGSFVPIGAFILFIRFFGVFIKAIKEGGE